MSDQELQAVEEVILDLVTKSPKAMSPSELYQRAAHEPTSYSASVVSEAMWQLLSAGKLGLTKDLQLTAA